MAQVEPTCRPVRGTGCPSSMLMGFLQKHGLHLITFLCPAGMLYPPVCRQIVQSGHVSLMGAWWWVIYALMFECEILLCMGRGEIALPLFDINGVRCSFLPPFPKNVQNTAFPVASLEYQQQTLGWQCPAVPGLSCPLGSFFFFFFFVFFFFFFFPLPLPLPLHPPLILICLIAMCILLLLRTIIRLLLLLFLLLLLPRVLSLFFFFVLLLPFCFFFSFFILI